MGKGVSACATCDGFFYKGQDVVVVGGGNTAVEEALYLSNIAKTRDRGPSARQVPRRGDPGRRADGEDAQRRQRARRLEPHARRGAGRRIGRHRRAAQGREDRRHARTSPSMACSSRSATRRTRSIFEGQLDMAGGYIKVKSGTEGNATATSVPGVFAAGDVADHVYRQAVTSAGHRLHGGARRRGLSSKAR